MKQFHYKVYDEEGGIHEGSLAAKTKREAAVALFSEGLSVIRLSEKKEPRRFFHGRPFGSRRSLSLLASSWAALLFRRADGDGGALASGVERKTAGEEDPPHCKRADRERAFSIGELCGGRLVSVFFYFSAGSGRNDGDTAVSPDTHRAVL